MGLFRNRDTPRLRTWSKSGQESSFLRGFGVYRSLFFREIIRG
jgi:hypothetical protein